MTPRSKSDPKTKNNGPHKTNGAQTSAAKEDSAAIAPAEAPEWQREFFIRHGLNTARIPRRFLTKTIESFKGRDKLRRDLRAGARGFVASFNFEKAFPQGLWLAGPVGSGKSHLAAAILREVVGKGYSGLFYNSPDLLRDIRSTFGGGEGPTEDELITEITDVDLLVLDDVGAEKITDFVRDRFYLIVNKRYEECKPMIVTTNMEEEELVARLGEATVSRLAEMCRKFATFPDEDWRRRDIE